MICDLQQNDRRISLMNKESMRDSPQFSPTPANLLSLARVLFVASSYIFSFSRSRVIKPFRHQASFGQSS